MILATHAVTGAAAALVLRRYPVLALIVSFLSHFLLDSFPHWHYKILSRESDAVSPFGERMSFGYKFIKDIFRTGIDFGIGLIISLGVSQYFFPGSFWLTFLGALAGALPDALQVVYYRFPNFKPFYYFQRFHESVHAKTNLDDKPVKGILQQIAMSAMVVSALIFWGR